MNFSKIFILSFLLIFGCTARQDQISFNSDIRPILNAKCMTCHGGVRQQGGLSFLFEEDLYRNADSGKPAVVKGDPNNSTLYKRIIHEDPELLMPLEGDPLNSEEVSLIKQWIKQGASWEKHWSFVPPNDIEIPTIEDEWATTNLDKLVMDRLQSTNLSPAPEASTSILLRRVYLDLIGLTPTLNELDKYLDDSEADRYEKVVDQLLESKHFGEKWASMWLDLARYADSQGFQKDKLRPTMWMYRDWVIKAFNDDMPFDQFTIEQLAGDLLGKPTDQQLLATAFHRNTMTNDEGGTDDEEYRVQAVLDRTNTTMEIWQGMTFSCVQCHSHPYDPISHQEYYAVKGYFNNTKDHDHYSEFPTAKLLSAAQQDLKKELIRLSEQSELNEDDVDYMRSVAKLASIKEEVIPIMQELPQDSSRENRLFIRGNWLMNGKVIPNGTPEVIGSTQKSEASNRLDFAQWLVDDKNPLTGRVIVNRIWEQIFGQGLVKTLEDFGTQGSRPSNPELLDYLAIRFTKDYEWSVKKLIKEIVMSSTYRQSSSINPEKYKKDPANNFLSSGPRVRLSAEQIRDQALAISGLLNREAYGPSVMPYQPEGVWNVIRHVSRWETSGDNQSYRRALYTFWRRVSPYPTMLLFDAPSRELCLSRRVRTNTPLQALAILNDPVYTESALALAKDVMKNNPSDPIKQIENAYRRATINSIRKEKLEVLKNQYDKSIKIYQEQPELLKELFAEETQSPELAALYNVSISILNLDEVIMKK